MKCYNPDYIWSDGTKGAYKVYEEKSSNQSKCLTETLMLTEESSELEKMLTEEELQYIVDVNKEPFAFDFSSEQKIKNLRFNH